MLIFEDNFQSKPHANISYRSWDPDSGYALCIQALQEILNKLIFSSFYWPGFQWLLVLTAQNSSNRPTTTYWTNLKPQSETKSSTLYMGEVESSKRMLFSCGPKNA